MEQFTCVKCNGPMVKGFVADHGNKSAIFKTLWFDGDAEQASIWGIQGDNISVDRSKQRVIRGIRCKQCGYLELYAV
ncbi:MAG: hypothetical protein JO053_16285 [Acidobacteria bacterium]|nr:hypothetical protein [Acidobacteriota bacterium]